jgi:hypothetical protein
MSTPNVPAGRYNRVGSIKGPLVIGGARSKMSEEDFVYVPMFKVAGLRDEVHDWLKTNHPDTVKEAMKSWYSRETLKNSAAIRKAFEAEISSTEEQRRQTNSIRSEMKQVNLMALVKLMSIYNEERKTRDSDSNNDKQKETKTLKTRLQEIIADKKVLDVTLMKENGTEGKKVNMKNGSLKGRLSQDKRDPFYNVVFNPNSKSSKLGVTNFMKNYGSFTDEQIAKIADAVSAGSTINIGRTKSPTRSPLVSPKRSGRKMKSVIDTSNTNLDELVDNL